MVLNNIMVSSVIGEAVDGMSFFWSMTFTVDLQVLNYNVNINILRR